MALKIKESKLEPDFQIKLDPASSKLLAKIEDAILLREQPIVEQIKKSDTRGILK